MVALEAAATLIQWLNVSFVIDVPVDRDDCVTGNAAARGEADEGKQNGAKRRDESECSGHDAGTLAETCKGVLNE